MTTEKKISGNRGEWSEFYTFCRLLRSGKLEVADRNLEPTGEADLPIIRIIRGYNSQELSYVVGEDSDTVEYYSGEQLIDNIQKTEFDRAADKIYEKSQDYERKGSFTIPELTSFMERVGCEKPKADPLHKEDIRIQIHDIKTGQKPVQGFSIKSYIGNDPTLLNAGETTNFRFLIENGNDKLMEEVNAIDTREKIKCRMARIVNDHRLIYDSMHSRNFERNLQAVDSRMPEIVAELLLVHYTEGIVRVSDAVSVLEENDPLGMNNPGFYQYKVKTLLRSIALGMVPSEPWYGKEDANGGYIVVKENGKIVCFFLYNRNEFEQYLFDCTRFERASTTRHKYMTVEKEGDRYYIDLNLQIRFMKPGYRPRNLKGTGIEGIQRF